MENTSHNYATTHEECYVAFLDVLGFKEIITLNTHDRVSQIYNSLEKYLNDDRVLSNKISLSLNNVRLKFNMVSDSILITTNNCSPEAFVSLVVITLRTLVAGFMAGTPLRGAIARGPLTLKSSELGSTAYGLALTKAYSLELLQIWSGCIIDQGIVEEMTSTLSEASTILKSAPYLIKYPTPLKGGTVDYWTVNWPLIYNYQSADAVRKAFESHGKKTDSPAVQEKIKNTEIYFINSQTDNAEYIEYFVLGKTHEADIELFIQTLDKLGYSRNQHNLRLAFQEQQSTHVVDEVATRAATMKQAHPNDFSEIVRQIDASTLHKSPAKWLARIIHNLKD